MNAATAAVAHLAAGSYRGTRLKNALAESVDAS